MPYSGAGDSKLPDHVKKLPEKKRSQWVHVWNNMMDKHHDEKKAFAAANAVIQKDKGLIQGLGSVDMRQLPQSEAGYDPMGAKGGKGCGNCNFFIPGDDACLVVQGDIVATGLSDFWLAMKTYEPPPMPVVIVGGDKEAARAEEPRVHAPTAPSLVERVKDLLFGPKIKPLAFVKDADGRLRFFMTVSNNYKDKHKEIITEEAHKAYIKYADSSGKYPEAWLWHTEGTKWGQVDWLDYADGFLVASGLVEKGQESTASKLAEQDTAISHGFFCLTTKGIITKYWSFEFSALPRNKAANEWTNFNLATEWEGHMGFSDEKKKWLLDMGVPEDRIGALEASNKALSEKLKALGVEFKEADFTESVQVMDALDKLTGVVSALKDEVVGISARVEKAEKSVDDKVAEAFTARTSPGGFSPANSEKTKVEDGAAERVKAEHAAGWWGEIVMAGVSSPAQGGN